MREELSGDWRSGEMEGCVFCRIVAGEVSAAIVHEDDLVVAFRDINPQAPVHLLLVPRKHIPDLNSLAEGDVAVVGRIVQLAVDLAKSEGIAETGFRLLVNCGPQAGQSVPHLHFHLLGGRPLGWPPG